MDLRLELVPFGHPDAERLIAAVQQEYVARYGGEDETPIDPLMFEPPLGSFYVGYVEGLPVVSGAWRRRDDLESLGSTAVAEVKRMYVAPAVRGQGLGRRMLAHLEESVRDAGLEVVVLETGDQQPEAMAMYASSGYVPVPKFGIYACHESSRCFGKRLR